MSKFKVIRLCEIAEVVAGQSPKSKYYNFTEGTPFLQGNRTFGHMYPSIDTYTSKVTKIASKNSVLMSVRAPVGDLNIANQDICIGRGLASLDALDGDNKFLYYLLKANLGNLLKNGTGTTYDSISTSDLKNIQLIIPNGHRKDISEILSALDDQIELNNKINQALEDFVQTLYNYWFVQFEFPNEEGKPYKSSGGKMVWNEELKRGIPEGWEVKNVLELVNWIGGTQPPKSEHIYEWREGYIRFIQNRDYHDNSHITYIKQTSTNKVCNEFDILMDKYGEAGKVRFGIAGAYNVALAKLEVINPDSREYIRSFFNDKNILEYLKNASIASTRASLNAQTLETIKVCYPTKDLLCKFETIAAQSIATILQNRQQNQELTQLRDYLLPLLMNGQVTVSDEMFQE